MLSQLAKFGLIPRRSTTTLQRPVTQLEGHESFGGNLELTTQTAPA
jgi:hypothetical protein